MIAHCDNVPPQSFGEEFEDRVREASEIIENECTLLDHIHNMRSVSTTGAYKVPPGEGPVWPIEVAGGDDLIQEIYSRARPGANHGKSISAMVIGSPVGERSARLLLTCARGVIDPIVRAAVESLPGQLDHMAGLPLRLARHQRCTDLRSFGEGVTAGVDPRRCRRL